MQRYKLNKRVKWYEIKQSQFNNGEYYNIRLDNLYDINNQNYLNEGIFINSYFLPYINDEIEGELNNNSSLKNSKIFPPINEDEQKKRISEILLENNFDINSIDSFNIFNYGSINFWLNICNYYYLHNNIEGYELECHIEIIFDHIKNYLNVILLPFKNALNKLDIQLNKSQLITLLNHDDFGPNIENWNYINLKLLFNLNGFGINTIIKIAIGIKCNLDDITKILIIYILNYDTDHGDTIIKFNYNNWKNYIHDFIDKYKLDKKIILNLSINKFNNIIDDMINDNDIVKINNYLVGKDIYDNELNIANKLIEIKNNKINLFENKTIENTLKILDDYEIDNYPLDDEQKNSIINFLINNVSITFAKAGCGKSSNLKGLITLLEEIILPLYKNIKIYFLTPTAKAKNRIEEIISTIKDDISMYYIKTIHSFVINKQIHEELTKYTNIFIIDETSMIDINILDKFLDIIPIEQSKIMFLGDDRQLQSINKGNILNDLINSNCINKTELINTYRYNKLVYLKNILTNILTYKNIDIIDGNINEFKFIDINDNLQKLENIIKTECLNNDIIITPFNSDIKLYTNIVREQLNPININNIELDIFINIINENNIIDIINQNNKKNTINEIVDYKIKKSNENISIIDQDKNNIIFYNQIEYNDHIYRIKDKVIYRHNFNDKGLYNGMTAKIIMIFEIDYIKYIIIKNDYNKKEYFVFNNNDDEILSHLLPAYIITIHNSQGSEYKNVLILLTKKYKKMINNNLLYTAMTRGCKSITIISNLDIINDAIKKKSKRKSLLIDMLKYYNNDNQLSNFKDYYLSL